MRSRGRERRGDAAIAHLGSSEVASAITERVKGGALLDRHAEALRELLAPAPAELQPRTVAKLDQVITAEEGLECGDPLNIHDRRSMDAAEPDGTLRSFRSNAVVRWEYRPGSSLYLVWSQRRSHALADGSFELADGLRDLSGVAPTNVLALKVSHRFSP